MSQSRKKRKERDQASFAAEVMIGLKLPEVLEAMEGASLAVERERELAENQAAEQAALIASTQESGTAPVAHEFDLKRTVESLLFASDRPLTAPGIRQLLGQEVTRADVQEALEQLSEEFSGRGIVLHDVAGGYQFRTHAASSHWVQKLIAGRPVRLSRAQLDSLAIIAYRQPITRPEIDDIRGVDSGSTLKLLLDRNLVRILGKKEEAGRPLLYGTTKDFLEFFNLSELRELPTLREFHELNDEGMAEVSKLGADIEGVDVGAVAAELAEERATAAKAAATAAAAAEVAKAEAKAAAAAEKALAAAEAKAFASGQEELDLAGEPAEALQDSESSSSDTLDSVVSADADVEISDRSHEAGGQREESAVEAGIDEEEKLSVADADAGLEIGEDETEGALAEDDGDSIADEVDEIGNVEHSGESEENADLDALGDGEASPVETGSAQWGDTDSESIASLAEDESHFVAEKMDGGGEHVDERDGTAEAMESELAEGSEEPGMSAKAEVVLEDLEDSDGSSEAEMGREDSDIAVESELAEGSEDPGIAVKAEVDSEAPDVVAEAVDSEVSDASGVVAEVEVDSEVSDVVAEVEVDSDASDVVAEVEVDSDASGVVAEVEVDSEVSDVVAEAEVDSEVPDVVVEAEVDSEVPDVVVEAEVDSEVPDVVAEAEVEDSAEVEISIEESNETFQTEPSVMAEMAAEQALSPQPLDREELPDSSEERVMVNGEKQMTQAGTDTEEEENLSVGDETQVDLGAAIPGISPEIEATVPSQERETAEVSYSDSTRVDQVAVDLGGVDDVTEISVARLADSQVTMAGEEEFNASATVDMGMQGEYYDGTDTVVSEPTDESTPSDLPEE